MGYLDYEQFLQTPIGNTNKLNLIYKNSEFCLNLGINLLNDDIFGKILNYHCFKYTKLREDIYFIKCNVVNIDENNKIINVPFTFLVNSKSFWRRFRIYLEDNPKSKLTSSDYLIEDFIFYVISGRISCDRIELNVLPSEQEDIDAEYNRISNSKKSENSGSLTDLKDFSNMHKCLKNGAKCYLTGFYHYNKRVCIDLFSKISESTNSYGQRRFEIIDNKNDGEKSYYTIQIDDSVNGRFVTYNDESSWFYYNENDPKAIKYRGLY